MQAHYLHALDIYLSITELEHSSGWRIPILYQAGLVYEHLHNQIEQKRPTARIITRPDELEFPTEPALQTVLDMTRLRGKFKHR